MSIPCGALLPSPLLPQLTNSSEHFTQIAAQTISPFMKVLPRAMVAIGPHASATQKERHSREESDRASGWAPWAASSKMRGCWAKKEGQAFQAEKCHLHP